MLMFLIGLALIGGGAWIMRYAYNIGEIYERYVFERKNEFGVVVLDSYDEKKMLERWNYKLYLIGKPLLFIAACMLLIGWFVMGVPVVRFMIS